MKQLMPHRGSFPGALAAVLTVVLSGCGSPGPAVAESADWTIPLGSYSAIRHSPLKQIDKQNASKLRLAWSMSTGTLRGQEGQPDRKSVV